VLSLVSCVWLLSRVDAQANPEGLKLVKWFMGLCVVMAFVTFLSSLVGGARETREVQDLRTENENLRRNLQLYRSRQKEYAANYDVAVRDVKWALDSAKNPLKPFEFTKDLVKKIETLKPRQVDEQ
jgi:hypothetical protein